MKKTYIIPETFCTDIVAESMLAASAEFKTGTINSEDEILVRENESTCGFWD